MLVAVVGTPVLGPLRSASVPAGEWDMLAACPVCGGAEALRDVAVVEGDEPGAIVAACVACEHVFLRRRPRDAWLAAFYAEDWDREGRSAGDGHPREPQSPDKVAGFCAPALPPGARVLDIGAGFGDQLLGFRARGHEVHGVEMSGHRAAYVRDVLGIPCPQGPIDANEMPGRADLVFSHHVLEHVADPAQVIERSVALLAPGGHVYVAVPNLWAEHPPQTFHFAPHLSQFTLRSLTRLLARHGLDVVRAQEGRELQVLAVLREGPVREPAAADPERFWARLGAWVLDAFGSAPGRRVLAWRKSLHAQRVYDAKRAAGVRARALGATSAAARRVPGVPLGIRRRVAPFAAAPTLRVLPVEVSPEDEVLPVRLRYARGPAPIWVK